MPDDPRVPAPGSARAYAFGVFVLDAEARVLFRDGQVVALSPKAVETLLALAERAGQMVSRDELIDRVWPDTFVEPNNLAQQISQVRRCLSERGDSPIAIETVARRGYRLVGRVQAVTNVAPAAPRAHPTSAADVPEVLYARSGDVNIAYQVVGTGPIDLVFVMGWVSHLEEFWTEPSFAAFLRRLASRARLILFDKRGTGLSDRVAESELPSLEQRIDDVRAVMEAVGSERAVLLGVSEGGPMCALFAATHPQRSLGLIMIGTYARRTWAPDYPWAPTPDAREAFYDEIRRNWGGPVGIDDRAPSRAHDPVFRQWWAHYLRHGASPGAALALTRMNAEIDVRDVLPAIRVPTLVLHRADDRCLRAAEGRYVAERIPGATYVEVPGNDHLPFVGDQDRLLREIDGFLGFVSDRAEAGSSLATILWVGRDAGTHASAPPVAAVREAVEGFRGAFSSHDDRAWLAAFDGPARAVRAASAVARVCRASGSGVRLGLHTGECLASAMPPSGHAVDIAREVAALARPGEVLVSRTVKDLVAGSGLRFEERGRHTFAGGEDGWRLYAVV